jgi:hypothetical protein
VLPLVDLFMPDDEVVARKLEEALARRDMSLTTEGIGQLPAFGLGAISRALASHLRALFPNDIGQLFTAAWNNSVTLREYLKKSAQSPGKDTFLQLSEHKIESKHRPHVALMKDGVEIARVPFDAAIEIVLQGAVLRLRDGEVQELQTGRVKGKATVKCFGAVIVRKEIDPRTVPGTISLQGTRAAAWLSPRPVRRAS